jgi:hypothetical protein
MTAAIEAAPRRRRGLKWLLILVTLAIVLWVGYWFAARQAATMAFDRAFASLAEAERDLACDQSALSGFPFRLDLDCNSLAFADRRANTAVTAARVTATAPLYRPGRVEAAIAGPVTIEAPDQKVSLVASWQDAVAVVEAGFGGLSGATIALDGLEIVPGAGKNRMPWADARADSATITAAPASGRDYRFTVDATGLALQPKKGDALPAMAIDADVTALDFGGSLGTDPGRTFAAWLADGGEMKVDRLTVAMGEVAAGATGSLSISADGLLSGNLTMRLAGLDQIPALAERLGLGSQDNLARVIGLAGAVMRPAADDPDARELALQIRDGVARIGLIPVGRIPRLRL